MGEDRVGKSAISCRYIFKKFTREYTPTIEDIFTRRAMVDEELAEIEIWDTPGLEEYKSLIQDKIKDRDGFLIIFNLSDKGTIDRIDKQYELI